MSERIEIRENRSESNIRYRIFKHVINDPGDVGSPLPEDDDETHHFFAKGRDLESAYVNHKYTEKEREILRKYESLDYLPPHSKVYKDWLTRQPSRLDWDRWIMMGLIGFCVGIVGFLLHQLIDLFADLKWEKAREFISEDEFLIAWTWVIGISLIFVIASSSLIVFIRPSAGGSGIPEIIAYLNGTLVRHIFNVKTLVVKFLSCVLAVSSGMPVGPEGPMIHLGASVGAGLSQFKSSTLGFRLPFFSRFRNSEDRRNFISAGAAAGVASAFGAPVGGLLFSMEEVSSFWNMKLSWQTFFCCMVASFTTDLFNSAFTAFCYQGNFGLFRTEKYILFQVETGIALNVIALVPTVIVGILGGILGAMFTFINLKIARARRLLLSHIKSPLKEKIIKLIEPMIIMIIMGTISVFLPAAFNCSQFTCHFDSKNHAHCDGPQPIHTEKSVEYYTCPKGTVEYINGTHFTNGSFNEVATILFLTGEKAIRHLFSRETHHQFDIIPMLVVLPFYFLLACWSAGTSIASGVVVPKMLIGGLMGRLIGRGMVAMFGVHTDSFWAWMDPGAFALLGAAAFFGGVSRLTMSLTVIMMELTNDVQFLLLIMVTIMVAKWVGDFVTHPFYHSLLEFKCIPFLDSEPVIYYNNKTNLNLELFMAKHAATSSVKTVKTNENVSYLAKLLLQTKHSGFPVVRNLEDQPNTFCGLVTRTEISVLLCHETAFEQCQIHKQEEPEILDVDYSEFCDDDIEKLSGSNTFRDLLKKLSSEDFDNMQVNLLPYTNQSAMSVQETFSLHRTYIVFRSLGLRHLTVINRRNQVVGIITRKDLMGFQLEEKLGTIINQRILAEGQGEELS